MNVASAFPRALIILGCRFVVASVLNTRRQTSVSKKTLNPTYAPKDSTFDFPIYLSLADKLGVLELVVWDKDMLSKEYLGEVALPLDHWFLEKDGTPRPYSWDDENNKVSESRPFDTVRGGAADSALGKPGVGLHRSHRDPPSLPFPSPYHISPPIIIPLTLSHSPSHSTFSRRATTPSRQAAFRSSSGLSHRRARTLFRSGMLCTESL